MSISSRQGTVIIDGVPLTIWRIELVAGEILLHCSAMGPVAERKPGPATVTVLGHDGRGIAQWDNEDHVGWPALNEHGILTSVQPLRVRTAEGV